MAFQTHEGVFAWNRLTMGCRPASQVQQTAFHTAMDKYMPPEWRHRIALYADDMAAEANTLEELFEIYKALVKTLAKAGIQIKPQQSGIWSGRNYLSQLPRNWGHRPYGQYNHP